MTDILPCSPFKTKFVEIALSIAAGVQTDGASAAETVSSSLISDLDATWSCLFDATAAH
jgi:hypothetical protein